MPVCEWASELAIGEVTVPGELVDLGLPKKAEWEVGERSEAKRDAGAGAGCHAADWLG